ncbi:UNKNOWN [Stylonychia lemnae]|uniref:Uncharacterized protein n=1 Tax=Stylonychia lemnae TaxID=5949 RepID=A0A077ZY40_STYLE|nr:UNKNOWN [Stylonychia lemnae]|eukprot:CDW74542.1 UNKNOWN [Stylonychia lemnae]
MHLPRSALIRMEQVLNLLFQLQDLSIDKLDQLKHLADKKCLLDYLMLMLDSKIALQNRYLLAFVEELEFSQRLAQDDQQRDDEEEITEKMLEDQFNYGTQLARVASTGTEYYYMKKTKKYISDYYPTFLHKIKVEFEAIDENATKNMDELGSVAVDLTLQMLKLKIYVAQDGFHIGKLNVFKTEDFLKIEKKVNEEIQELRNYPITEKPKVEKPDFSIINI